MKTHLSSSNRLEFVARPHAYLLCLITSPHAAMSKGAHSGVNMQIKTYLHTDKPAMSSCIHEALWIPSSNAQVVWAEGKVFHGFTPSAPLNKLALYIGDLSPLDGMQVCSTLQLQTAKHLDPPNGMLMDSIAQLFTFANTSITSMVSMGAIAIITLESLSNVIPGLLLTIYR